MFYADLDNDNSMEKQLMREDLSLIFYPEDQTEAAASTMAERIEGSRGVMEIHEPNGDIIWGVLLDKRKFFECLLNSFELDPYMKKQKPGTW